MSYNILKKNVRFSGDSAGTIEGIVDTTSDQVISGSKDFNSLTGSNAKFLNQIDAQSASFAGTVVLNNDVTVGSGKRIYLDGTGISANQGPFLYGYPSAMYIDGDDSMFLYHDTRMSIFQGSSRVIHLETGSVGIEQPILAVNLSASNYISASSFIGDGSQLSNLGEASSVAASNIVGKLNGSQISASTGLTTSGNNLIVNLNGSRGIVDDSGLSLDIGNLSNHNGSYSNAHIIPYSGSGIGNKHVTLQYLETNMSFDAARITTGTFSNDLMPTAISVTSLSASSDLEVGGHISGSGDIVLLNNGNIVLGGNSEIQFDDGLGALSIISQGGGTNRIQIDGHNKTTIRCDDYFNVQDEYNNDRFVIDLRLAAAIPKIILTNLALSSSTFISASAYAIAGGTIVDENANTNFGQLTFFVTSSADTTTPADNEKATFYVDEAANKFFVRVRYSDGTVKSGSIDLV